jgi:DNA repair exonuclease SbcCD ATPase subunit
VYSAARYRSDPSVREAMTAAQRQRRIENPIAYAEEIRRASEAARARRQNHPKRAVREATHRALASGKLTREPCEVCGSEVSEAHHADYSKPLEVRWLCRTHHMEQHRSVV